MTSRQKHKGMKRPRSWHRRGAGPDRAFRAAMAALGSRLVVEDPAPTYGQLDRWDGHR